jgi:two-component system, chemotaxis family, protein-glutamate methylesterase/glutaminase
VSSLVSHQLQAPAAGADRKIRVLVVDDSVVIRRLVAHALSEESQIEVVGTAANGAIALQKIPQLKPDVITLDIEMPEMNGLDALRQIRKLHPAVRVIMFSTLTERGAAVTFEALSLGASDYVAKAANVGSLEKSMLSLRSELVPKMKQFFRPEDRTKKTSPASAPGLGTAVTPRVVGKNSKSVGLRKIVAIGVSTGGPNALAEVMPMFPKDFPLPILIVQHMPPLFTRFLSERLDSLSHIRVEEAKAGARLEPGKAFLAAGGTHMRVQNAGGICSVAEDDGPPVNSCKPAVDVLFNSVAAVFGGATVAAMLTGMGADGLRGTETLARLGAYVIAQDEASSVVWGMPGAIVKAGLANATVDLRAIVPEILKQVY